MKKLFLASFVVALSFCFTACGDSPEKLADDAIALALKCNKKEMDKDECKKQEKILDERKEKMSKEDQKKAEELVFAKFLMEVKKEEDAKKEKRKKEKE